MSDISITDLDSLAAAIQVLHKTYQVPHVIITSLRLTPDNQTVPSRAPSKPPSGTQTPAGSPHRDASKSHPSAWGAAESSNPPKEPQINIDDIENLTIIGSTATSDYRTRLFRIDTPVLPLFFSGTGDMFAALTVPRLIEAVQAASTPDFDLRSTPSWRSPDDVAPEDLPLAKAVQKVLASMQAVLAKTTAKCEEKMAAFDKRAAKSSRAEDEDVDGETQSKRHLALMNASEVQVVRYVKELVDPPDLERFKPRRVAEGGKVPKEVGDKKPDGLNVLHLGLGTEKEGAVQVLEAESKEEIMGPGPKEEAEEAIEITKPVRKEAVEES